MINLISNIPNVEDLSAQEVLTYLTTSDPQRKKVIRNEDPNASVLQSAGVGPGGVVKRLQAAFPGIGDGAVLVANQIYVAIKERSEPLALTYATSIDGLDFGAQEVQDALDVFEFGNQLPSEFHEPLRAFLKSFGWDYRSRWQRFSNDDPPTVEEIQAVLDQLQLERDRKALREFQEAPYNTHIASVFDGDSPTVDNLIAGHLAMAAALEALKGE